MSWHKTLGLAGTKALGMLGNSDVMAHRLIYFRATAHLLEGVKVLQSAPEPLYV